MTNRITYSIRSHADPKKDPATGKSLDELSEAGIEQAKDIGSKLVIPQNGIFGYHSPKDRARETLVYMMEAASQPPFMAVAPLLDVIGIKDLKPYLVDEQGNKRSMDDVVDLIMRGEYHTPEDELFYDAGHRVLKHVQNTFTRNVTLDDGNEVLIENISHGPVVDAALHLLLKAKEEVTPITLVKDSVKDLGGSFKAGENFTITFDYRERGTAIAPVKVSFREQTYQLQAFSGLQLTGAAEYMR